jgi:hypothetical protein
LSISEILLGVAAWLFSMALIVLFLLVFYGVVVIVFRYAFEVELWNPFGG